MSKKQKKDLKVHLRTRQFVSRWIQRSYFHAADLQWIFAPACPHWQVGVMQDVVILCNIYYQLLRNRNVMTTESWGKKRKYWAAAFRFYVPGTTVRLWVIHGEKYLVDSRWESSGPCRLDHRLFLSRPEFYADDRCLWWKVYKLRCYMKLLHVKCGLCVTHLHVRRRHCGERPSR